MTFSQHNQQKQQQQQQKQKQSKVSMLESATPVAMDSQPRPKSSHGRRPGTSAQSNYVVPPLNPSSQHGRKSHGRPLDNTSVLHVTTTTNANTNTDSNVNANANKNTNTNNTNAAKNAVNERMDDLRKRKKTIMTAPAVKTSTTATATTAATNKKGSGLLYSVIATTSNKLPPVEIPYRGGISDSLARIPPNNTQNQIPKQQKRFHPDQNANNSNNNNNKKLKKSSGNESNNTADSISNHHRTQDQQQQQQGQQIQQNRHPTVDLCDSECDTEGETLSPAKQRTQKEPTQFEAQKEPQQKQQQQPLAISPGIPSQFVEKVQTNQHQQQSQPTLQEEPKPKGVFNNLIGKFQNFVAPRFGAEEPSSQKPNPAHALLQQVLTKPMPFQSLHIPAPPPAAATNVGGQSDDPSSRFEGPLPIRKTPPPTEQRPTKRSKKNNSVQNKDVTQKMSAIKLEEQTPIKQEEQSPVKQEVQIHQNQPSIPSENQLLPKENHARIEKSSDDSSIPSKKSGTKMKTKTKSNESSVIVAAPSPSSGASSLSLTKVNNKSMDSSIVFDESTKRTIPPNESVATVHTTRSISPIALQRKEQFLRERREQLLKEKGIKTRKEIAGGSSADAIVCDESDNHNNDVRQSAIKGGHQEQKYKQHHVDSLNDSDNKSHEVRDRRELSSDEEYDDDNNVVLNQLGNKAKGKKKTKTPSTKKQKTEAKSFNSSRNDNGFGGDSGEFWAGHTKPTTDHQMLNGLENKNRTSLFDNLDANFKKGTNQQQNESLIPSGGTLSAGNDKSSLPKVNFDLPSPANKPVEQNSVSPRPQKEQKTELCGKNIGGKASKSFSKNAPAGKLGLTKQNCKNAKKKKPTGTPIIPGQSTANGKGPAAKNVEWQGKKNNNNNSSNRQKGKAAKKVEMVEILDSDDSEPEEMPAQKCKQPQNPPSIGMYKLTRIAIGSLVAFTSCKLEYDTNKQNIFIEYDCVLSNGSTRADTVSFSITKDSFVSARIFTPTMSNQKDMYGTSCFISMVVNQNKDEKLFKFKMYDPNSNNNAKKYLVFEFACEDELTAFVDQLSERIDDFGSKVHFLLSNQVLEYAEALVKHGQVLCDQEQQQQQHELQKKGQQKETSKQSGTKPPSPKNIFRNAYENKNPDEILLVFPFNGDKDKIEEAAKDLNEASSGLLPGDDGEYNEVVENSTVELPQNVNNVSNVSSASNPVGVSAESNAASASNSNNSGKVRRRKHYVTIRVEDYDKLHPREWLNDSLVDFWMQWISRNDTNLASSSHHFFTSHFYSVLENSGIQAVQSWTAKKDINIFEKKFIFIPINKDLHWSLCVVVNPGKILNGICTDEQPNADVPMPCLIFLDSLKMHNKKKVGRTVRGWLNSEWQRLRAAETGQENPFNDKSLTMFNPAVPYQNNTWDCGVFVCRYAYAVYQLRQRDFTYRDAGLRVGTSKSSTKSAFYKLITDGSEFKFNMRDIERFREEYKHLIENLSDIYIEFKRKEQAQKRKDKQSQHNEVEEDNEDVIVTVVGTSKSINAENSNVNNLTPDNSNPIVVIETSMITDSANTNVPETPTNAKSSVGNEASMNADSTNNNLLEAPKDSKLIDLSEMGSSDDMEGRDKSGCNSNENVEKDVLPLSPPETNKEIPVPLVENILSESQPSSVDQLENMECLHQKTETVEPQMNVDSNEQDPMTESEPQPEPQSLPESDKMEVSSEVIEMEVDSSNSASGSAPSSSADKMDVDKVDDEGNEQDNYQVVDHGVSGNVYTEVQI